MHMEEIRSMKTALSAIAIVTALTLASFVGGRFAVADDSAQREDHGRFSPEDRAAFLDAGIAALKAGLELTAEQEKNWAPLESAMRDLAKQRAERFAAWRERRDDNQDGDAKISPVERLARASERPSPFTTAWTTARSVGSPCFSVDPWVAARVDTGAATAEERPIACSPWRVP